MSWAHGLLICHLRTSIQPAIPSLITHLLPPLSPQGYLSQSQYANEVGMKRAPNFTAEQRAGLIYPIFAAYQRAKMEGRR